MLEKINPESIEAISSVQEIINSAFLKRKEEKAWAVSEMVKNLTHDLPIPLKAIITEHYDEIKKITEDQEVLKKAVMIFYNLIIAGYERKITDEENIPNEAYAKLDAMEKIDALFADGDPKIDDFKKIARVSFDLNGLKAANDLNSGDHNKGDMYLLVAVQAIRSPEVIEYCQKNKINFDPNKVTRDGGDEFGCIITSAEPFTREALDGFIEVVQRVLWNNEDVAKILDFDNPAVLAKFLSKESSDVIEEIDKKYSSSIKEFKKNNGIPENYAYRGAMSAGAATLYDSLTDKQFDEKNKILSGEKYHRRIQKMMGAMRSTSDRRMDKNKEDFKESLPSTTVESIKQEMKENGIDISGISNDDFEKEVANRRFLAEVYSRTDAERKLRKENEAFKKENFILRENLLKAVAWNELAIDLIREEKIEDGLKFMEEIKKIKVEQKND